MFDIRVERVLTSTETASVGAETFGRITVGDFSERFLMSLSYWSPEHYQQQWHAALVRLATTRDANSCLRVQMMLREIESRSVRSWDGVPYRTLFEAARFAGVSVSA